MEHCERNFSGRIAWMEAPKPITSQSSFLIPSVFPALFFSSREVTVREAAANGQEMLGVEPSGEREQ